MLRLENLRKSFGGVVATNDVTLDFPAGSLTAIIGPNGAGKTTIFNLVTGQLKPDSGRVLMEGRDLAGASRLAILRSGIARAFQVASIFPSLTVEEAILAALQSHHRRSGILWQRFPLPDLKPRALEILDLMGLARHARTQSRNLSHGDQKLLDIALALALDPKVLLLDEPTAGMGPDERWQMIDRVHGLWQRARMTVVFIEHDMDIVFKIAQTIRVLKYGAVLAEGTAAEIRRNPEVIEAYLGQDIWEERA